MLEFADKEKLREKIHLITNGDINKIIELIRGDHVKFPVSVWNQLTKIQQDEIFRIIGDVVIINFALESVTSHCALTTRTYSRNSVTNEQFSNIVKQLLTWLPERISEETTSTNTMDQILTFSHLNDLYLKNNEYLQRRIWFSLFIHKSIESRKFQIELRYGFSF